MLIQPLRRGGLDGALRFVGLRVVDHRPLLPNKPRGVPRWMIAGVERNFLAAAPPGAPWADIPPLRSAHDFASNRFNRWRVAGVWDRLWRRFPGL